MPLLYPDELRHNNPSFALVNSNQLRGTAYPLDYIYNSGSVPNDKRQVGIILFASASQEFYGYSGQTTASVDWNNSSNWVLLAAGSGFLSEATFNSWTGSAASQFAGTASYITASGVDGPYGLSSVLSSSHAVSASYAPNFANTDLTLSGSRTHELNDNILYIAHDANGDYKNYIYLNPPSQPFPRTSIGYSSSYLNITATSAYVDIDSDTKLFIDSDYTKLLANDVQVTGSLDVTGGITGSFTGSLTGSVYGTASWAENAITASYATSSVVDGPYGFDSVVSSSHAVSASNALSSSYAFSSSYALSSSYASSSLSSSYALTASYVEGSINDFGVSPLTVVAATTTQLTPTAVYDNGPLNDGIGSFLSGSLNGTLPSIDSQTLVVGDRVLIKDQSISYQNGVYEVTQTGSAVAEYILTRTADSNETSEFDPQIVIPSLGTTNQGKIFAQSTNEPIVGVDPIVYVVTTTGNYVTVNPANTTQYNVPFWNSVNKQLNPGGTAFRYESNNKRLVLQGGTLASIALAVSGSISVTGSISGSRGVINPLTASYAITASHAIGAFVNGGNSFGAAAVLGTNDEQRLDLETNGIKRFAIDSDGEVFLQSPDSASSAVRVIRQPFRKTTNPLTQSLDAFTTDTNAVYYVKAYVAAYSSSAGNVVAAMSGEMRSHWYADSAGNATQIGTTTYVTSSVGFSTAPNITFNWISSAPLASGQLRLEIPALLLGSRVFAGSMEYVKLIAP